jgi:segregation and condensation protein A
MTEPGEAAGREEGSAAAAPAAAADFVVDLDGYEGPLDVLLDLARTQKVDLTRISILELAEQYLAFVDRVRAMHLELAAEYLVMAAWLAYLKSRLLLPKEGEPDPVPAEQLAAALAAQLARLEAMRAAGARLFARPQLGAQFFARGCPPAPVAERAPASLDLGALTAAYVALLNRRRRVAPLAIKPTELTSVDEALMRIRRSLGGSPGWASLMRFLPEETLAGLHRGSLSARSRLAATFSASLELARRGDLELRQLRPFGPIYVKAAPGRAPDEGQSA